MDLLQQYLQEYSYICIFLVVFLEYANLPIPSEVVLPLIGFLVAEKYIGYTSALLVSVLAGVLGSLLLYYIGMHIGVKVLANKDGKYSKAIKKSVDYIKKHRKVSVMLARNIPLIRTAISMCAGIYRMNLFEYTLYSSLGILIWNGVLIGMGVLFAENLNRASVLLQGYTYIVLFLVLVVLLLYLRKKINSNKVSE